MIIETHKISNCLFFASEFYAFLALKSKILRAKVAFKYLITRGEEMHSTEKDHRLGLLLRKKGRGRQQALANMLCLTPNISGSTQLRWVWMGSHEIHSEGAFF